MSFDKPTAICGETRAFIWISEKSDNAFSASTISYPFLFMWQGELYI
jgi:hypothetical protein